MLSVDVTVGTVTVTVLVLVWLGAVVDGVALGVDVAVVDVTSGVVVAVVVTVVVLAAAITPQATRLPASPVANVASSGPGVPFFWL